jgi:uncharacterized protein YdaU (DUF1376 family)
MNQPYFPLYVDKFLADHGWLTNEEIGATMRLLIQAWKDDISGTLPDDDAILARMACVDGPKWQEMKPVIMRPFKLGADGRWHHTELRALFEKSRRFSKSRQENAKRRWGESSDASAKQVQSTSNGSAKQKASSLSLDIPPTEGERGSPDFWKYGLSVLAPSGDSEKSLRALLAKKLNEYDQETVMNALVVTASKARASPKSYFLGVLGNGRKKGAAPKMQV